MCLVIQDPISSYVSAGELVADLCLHFLKYKGIETTPVFSLDTPHGLPTLYVEFGDGWTCELWTEMYAKFIQKHLGNVASIYGLEVVLCETLYSESKLLLEL